MIAVILGIIYLGQDYRTKEGIRNITGALFLMLTNQTFSNMFPVVQVSHNSIRKCEINVFHNSKYLDFA